MPGLNTSVLGFKKVLYLWPLIWNVNCVLVYISFLNFSQGATSFVQKHIDRLTLRHHTTNLKEPVDHWAMAVMTKHPVGQILLGQKTGGS